MKSLRKVVRRVTFAVLAVLVGNILGCHPAGIPAVEAATVPSVECTSDIHCRPGQFCRTEGFHPRKFCSPCQDCSKINRHPNQENECAKRLRECGPCLDGYVETHEGGVCKLQSASEESSDESKGTGITVYNGNKETTENSTPSVWLIAGCLAVVALLCLVGCAMWSKNKRAMCVGSRETRPDRIELHHFSPASQRSWDARRSPAAPAPTAPVEYQQQHAYHTPTAVPLPSAALHSFQQAYRLETEVKNPRFKMERLNRADPFQAGQGAGDWALPLLHDEANEQQNLEELEDSVDGIAPGAVQNEMNALLPNAEEENNAPVPMLEDDGEYAGLMFPLALEDGVNALDQENIEGIINNNINEMQAQHAVQAVPLVPLMGNAREVEGTPTFDPSETRVDLTTLVASGPGSPESNDSGTNMEDNEGPFSDNDLDEDEDETEGASRQVPVLAHQPALNMDSVLFDDDSFDSMYEDALVGDVDEFDNIEDFDNA